MIKKFWQWYEKHYLVNVGTAAFLFLLQIIHLIWLIGDVVIGRLTGEALFHLHENIEWLVILVDYTEIPAIISVSLVYINEIRKGKRFKPILYLIFLNSQWLHIFWIPDEFVVQSFGGTGVALPLWLAWIAILIDYLELPVIVETLKKFFQAVKQGDKTAIQESLREE